jgi:DNA-binding response OmpR family regulator
MNTLAQKPLVMLVDDDPSHLQLYAWIVDRGGFQSHSVLAKGKVEDLPLVRADIAVLDYRLGPISSADVAKRVQVISPGRPILILSDAPWMPDEFTSLCSAFVRKGEPQLLLDQIGTLLNHPPQS